MPNDTLWPDFEADQWAFQQARYELGMNADLSQVLLRAQELKEDRLEHSTD